MRLLLCRFPIQVASKPRKKRPSARAEKSDTKAPKLKKTKLKPGDPEYDPYDFTSSEEEEEEGSHDQESKSHDPQDTGEEESMDTTESAPPTELTEERSVVLVELAS